MVKYSSDGEVWVENAPYCPPEGKKEEEPPKQKEDVPPVKVTQVDESVVQPDIFRRRTGATARHDKHQLLGTVHEGMPSRSLSVSYYAQPVPIRRRGDMRRKSMTMIKSGVTGEVGSVAFTQALEKDAEHEIHPGWKSVRRIAGVLGYVWSRGGVVDGGGVVI